MRCVGWLVVPSGFVGGRSGAGRSGSRSVGSRSWGGLVSTLLDPFKVDDVKLEPIISEKIAQKTHKGYPS